MSELLTQITALIQGAQLDDRARKALLGQVVAENWGPLPVWSTLNKPAIKEVETATAGSGIVITFVEDGVRKVLLGEAGEHYANALNALMIAGGFINLTDTEGSTLVPAVKGTPESGFVGAAREGEQEFKTDDGQPLLVIDPTRLKLMDTNTLAFPSGEKRVVLGLMLELTADEITTVKKHVKRIAQDAVYRAAVAQHTTNEHSGKPEVARVGIYNLDDVAAGNHALLHRDQLSLFRKVQQHFGAG